MNATRSFFVSAVLAPMLIAACSTGEDVTLVPAQTSTALSCDVSPGEDICHRTFDFPADQRERIVAFLQAAALLSGEAHEVVERVLTACQAMTGELGISVAVIPEDPELAKRSADCSFVKRDMDRAGVRPDSITVGVPMCSTVPPLQCLPAKAHTRQRQRCEPPSVTAKPLVDPKGDPARAQMILDALARHGSELAWVARQLLETKGLLEFVASASGQVVSIPLSQAHAQCVGNAAKLITKATEELNVAVDASSWLGVTSPLQ